MAVADLLHLLDLLLLQLGPPLSNPHEVPAQQLTLQPTLSNPALPHNRARVRGSSDRWPQQLRKLDPFLRFNSLPFSIIKLDYDPTDDDNMDHSANITTVAWQWAQVLVTPSEECSEDLAPQLSNNKRTTL